MADATFKRIVDITSRITLFKDFPHQETLQIERWHGHDDASLLVSIASRLGISSAVVATADIMRFIGDDGNLTDEFWDGKQSDKLAWYKLYMESEAAVLVFDATSNSEGEAARRRLERWIDEDSQMMLVLIVDQVAEGAWPAIRNESQS